MISPLLRNQQKTGSFFICPVQGKICNQEPGQIAPKALLCHNADSGTATSRAAMVDHFPELVVICRLSCGRFWVESRMARTDRDSHRAGRRKMPMVRETAAAYGKDSLNHDERSPPPPRGVSIVFLR
jgi:hypothetical protein